MEFLPDISKWIQALLRWGHVFFAILWVGTSFTFNYLDNKLPSKILLSGEKGIGKCTLAYHLINFVLSKDEEYSYDYKNCEINTKV